MKGIFKQWQRKWRQYKYRFVPWIALNLKNRSVRMIPKGSEDEILDKMDFRCALYSFFTNLSYAESAFTENNEELYHNNLDVMYKCLGFVIQKQKSQLKTGGEGVFVTQGRVKAGTVVSIYPGTIYEKHEPIFFQSLGNPFIFRCIDGVLIDGNNQGLSKSIFKSCQGRDRIGPYLSCDSTWLSPFPGNPMNVGQFVNNHSKTFPANVAYQEYDLPVDFSFKLRKYIPNVFYSPSVQHSSQNRLIRMVVLVSTREIQCDEELFSTYFTLIE